MKNKFNKTFKKKNRIKNKKYTIKDKTKYYSTDKNTLLLVVDSQEKYRKWMSNKYLKNFKKIYNYFEKHDYPIAFTRYARCKNMKNCVGKNKNALTNLEDFVEFTEYKELTTWSYNTNKWQIIKEYSNNKYPIFETETLNAFNNIEFLKMLKSKNIKKIVIVGGWTTWCIISTAHASISQNILPIIVKDCIFDGENNVNNNVFLQHSAVLVKTKDLIK